MTCTNIDPIHNCGRCIFNYMDTVVFKRTSSLTIARIASNVLWVDTSTECCESSTTQCILDISCSGNVEITKECKVRVLTTNDTIDICRKLLNTWYTTNSSNINKGCNEIMSKTIESIQASTNINKLRTETMKLAKYIEKVNLGNRISDIKVFPSVEIERTCFKLSDMYLVSRLTATALTGILGAILYHVRYLEVSTTFVNLEMCYVTYTGELAISPNLKSTNCNIKSMKSIYSQYLNTWCKNNFSRCNEIKKIKKSIDVSNRGKDLNELYDNCINLLNTLEH